jgi:hypothetical protein
MANGQNTFINITRNLRLYVPQLPVTLAEQFIRDRYRKIISRRDWSATRRESQFILSASKSDGTTIVIRGSTTVAGAGTSFASTDVGRQFKQGVGSPVYTITAVDVNLQELTLDQAFGGASGTGTYYVFDGYVTPPEDFLRFILVSDPLQGWKLRHWITSQELMAMDPMRTFFGQPYVLADRMFNLYTSNGVPRPQYECWPYTTANRVLYYTYIAQPDDLVNDSDIPIWPITTDVLVKGALADVARWPGTMTDPNPYFQRPEYWRSYDADFENHIIDLERQDEDIYITMLDLDPFSSYPLAPLSASFVQSHALR